MSRLIDFELILNVFLTVLVQCLILDFLIFRKASKTFEHDPKMTPRTSQAPPRSAESFKCFHTLRCFL